MQRKLAPPAAVLIIGLMLVGSAGIASAAPAATSGSWFAPLQQLMMCISGNPFACMAPTGVPGAVSVDGAGGPCIRNR